MDKTWDCASAFNLWIRLQIMRLPVILCLREIWMFNCILQCSFTIIIDLVICFTITNFESIVN